MRYLWEPETLQVLLKHRAADVRVWAASHLLALYPETEGELLRRLPELQPDVAEVLLLQARGVSCPPGLYTFFQRTSSPFLKARALALLLRGGQKLAPAQLAAVEVSGVLHLLADTLPGYQFLLQRYRHATSAEPALLKALAVACHSTVLLELLSEASSRKARRQLCEQLGEAWGCDVSDLSRIRHAHEALQALQHSLTPLSGAPALAPWQQELATALAIDRQGLTDLAEAARVRLARQHQLGQTEIDLLLACTLAARRDARCQQQLSTVHDVATLWSALTLRPWHCVVGAQLLGFLRSQDPAPMVSTLRQALAAPYAVATLPFALLNALEVPGREALFLEAYQGDRGLTEDGEQALLAAGPASATAVAEHFCQQPPEPLHLFLLGKLPTAAAEAFLWEHWEHYMAHAWSNHFVEVLGQVASERFLAPLLREWRQGEVMIGRTITLLATLHSVQPPELPRIRQDTTVHDRAFKQLRAQADASPERALRSLLERGGALTLPLRCTACHRTYHYEITSVYVHPSRTGEYRLGRIIQCKGCGSIETYEQTPATWFVIEGEMMRLGLLLEFDPHQSSKKAQEWPSTAIVLQEMQIVAAGRSFDNIGDAYRFLQEKIALEPDNAGLHRRLGNVLKNGACPALAMPAYLEAIRLDANEAEAYYNLVEIFLEQERYQEALPYLQTLIPLCRDSEMPEDVRRNAFASLLAQVAVLEQKTGQHLSLFPVPEPAEGAAIARQAVPSRVHLHSLDLADPDDFERAYHMFRTGRVPDDMPRRGHWRRRLGAQPHPEALPIAALPSMPQRHAEPKIGRNAPCSCGSGLKYKRCCGR